MKTHLQKLNLAKILQKIIIISLILPIATSCQKKLNRTDNVAIVDDEYVTKDLYSKELTFYTSYYTKKYGDNYLNEKNKDGQTNYETLEKNLLDSLIMDQVMLNDLKNENYKMNDVEYENLHKGLVENLKNEESLYANIEAINSDELSFSDALFRDSIKFEHKKMFKKNGSIKDEDVLDYFEKNDKLQKMYKYNALIFDDKLEAEKILDKIKDNQDFKNIMNSEVKNFDVFTSEFVYNDDDLLQSSGLNKIDQVSKVFEYENKYIILMINSYKENKNDLLINAKEYYTELKYEDYLKELIKKSKIKVFL